MLGSLSESHWEVNTTGCPVHWSALEQQEKGSTLGWDREAPSSAVSLQHPLLTKFKFINMPAGKKKKKVFAGSNSDITKQKNKGFAAERQNIKTEDKDH